MNAINQELNLTTSPRAARDRLILEYVPLVKTIAARMRTTLPAQADFDDLVHAGILGLFDAAAKFDQTKQVGFAAYAKFRIRGAMIDSLRQSDWASRGLRQKQREIEQAGRELTATLKRTPAPAEVAEKLGVTIEQWHRLRSDLHSVGLISASASPNEQSDAPVPDYPADPASHPDNICVHEQLRSVLNSAMQSLPDRYRKIIRLYYSEGMTLKEIGSSLGINQTRVAQIHGTALRKMYVVLRSNGIASRQALQ